MSVAADGDVVGGGWWSFTVSPFSPSRNCIFLSHMETLVMPAVKPSENPGDGSCGMGSNAQGRPLDQNLNTNPSSSCQKPRHSEISRF